MSNRRDQRDAGHFLEFLVNSVPRIEAPPFFAAKVANLAQVEIYSFAGSLQLFSRRLVPVFMTLMILVCLAVYRWSTPDPLVESAFFYDEEHLAETITLEYVVDSLAIASDEQNENH